MQQLEYTPSVYLECTNQKHINPSAEIHFQLSSAHHQSPYQPLPSVPSLMINLFENVVENPSSNIQTQELFLEFNHNFVVTFDVQAPETLGTQNIRKTGQFAQQASIMHANGVQQKEAPQTCEQSLSKIDLSLLPHHSKENQSPQSSNCAKEVFCLNQIKTDPLIVQAFKEKDSPIEFEVKKRTVFKNKENIMSNAQQFKITTRKLINQNTLQTLNIQARSCKTKPKAVQSQKCIKSQYICKRSKLNAGKGLALDNNCSSNIFLQHKQARQSFRSTTLDNWKRKFNIKKKSLQKKTHRKLNIFHNPFVFN